MDPHKRLTGQQLPTPARTPSLFEHQGSFSGARRPAGRPSSAPPWFDAWAAGIDGVRVAQDDKEGMHIYGHYAPLVDASLKLYSGLVSLPQKCRYMPHMARVLAARPLAQGHDGCRDMCEQGAVAATFQALQPTPCSRARDLPSRVPRSTISTASALGIATVCGRSWRNAGSDRRCTGRSRCICRTDLGRASAGFRTPNGGARAS